MRLQNTRHKDLLRLIIVLVLALVFSIFSISTQFAATIYQFLAFYSGIPQARFAFNMVFFIIAGAMWLTYRKWRSADKRSRELENIISSISPDVLLVVDPFRRIRFCNGSIRRMFGYDESEVLGERIDILYWNLQTDHIYNSNFHAELEKRGFHIGRAMGQRRDGTTFPLEVITAHIGKGYGNVVLIRDITEQLKIQKALGEALQTSRDIIHSIPSGLLIYQYEPPDRFILIDGNRAAERMCGRKIEELRGKEFSEIWKNGRKNRLLEAYMTVLNTGKTIEADDLYYTNGNLHRAIRIHLFSMPGKRVGIAFEDVTEQRIMEERQENLIRQLREALSNIKTLSGLLPICARCKKIRDDSGYWKQVEKYIEEHSNAMFSHSLCPDCEKELYPDIEIDDEESSVEEYILSGTEKTKRTA